MTADATAASRHSAQSVCVHIFHKTGSELEFTGDGKRLLSIVVTEETVF